MKGLGSKSSWVAANVVINPQLNCSQQSFTPTILFAALVPRLLAIYHTLAARFTKWENHAHQSSHKYALTIKTFALSAIVSYLGLGLSAFVYVPFGEELMQRA